MAYLTKIKITGPNGDILKQIEISGSSRKENSLLLKAYNHGQSYDKTKVVIKKSSTDLFP